MNPLETFYFDIIKNQTISLVGDLKSEIQIMGLLESRGIDFDNVIFAQRMKVYYQKNPFVSTFLPYDLKKNLIYQLLMNLTHELAMTFIDFYKGQIISILLTIQALKELIQVKKADMYIS